jgi:hypothetical protein
MKCLSAMGIGSPTGCPTRRSGTSTIPSTSGGSLLAKGAYDVTVRFGKDAAEAQAVAEKLGEYEESDPFEGREYRFVVRRRSNAVISGRVPNDEEPGASDLRDVLDRAERCLTAA